MLRSESPVVKKSIRRLISIRSDPSLAMEMEALRSEVDARTPGSVPDINMWLPCPALCLGQFDEAAGVSEIRNANRLFRASSIVSAGRRL